MVWRNDRFEDIETPDAKIGDFLPTTMNLPEPPVIHKYVDMVKYFPKTEYVYGTDLHLAKEMIGNKNRLPADWWETNNNNVFTLPYPDQKAFRRTLNQRGERLDTIQKGCIYNYGVTKIGFQFPDKFELNRDNGRFIGLYIADGNCRDLEGNVNITKNNEKIGAK